MSVNTFNIDMIDFRVCVDAEFLESSDGDSTCGIIFREKNNEGTSYRFLISPGGYYTLEVYIKDENKCLPDFYYSEFIKNDGINSLMVELVGQKITLGVNGQILRTIMDDNCILGGIGVCVGKTKNVVAVRFRNFRLYSLER